MMQRWTLWCWGGQPIDPSIMGLNGHNGSVEAIAREVYHRLAGRLASITVYQRQWAVMFVALFCAFGGLGNPAGNMEAGARIASGCGVFALALLGGAMLVERV